MKKESGLPIYRRVEINNDAQEKLIRERGIGNDWNLGEEIQAEKLDILQLTFLMEQLREHLPIIRDWANATEYKQRALDVEEQARRQEVFAEILNHYEYLNDVRSRDFRRSLVTFEQLQQDPIFQIRAQRLLELVQGEGLMKELEKRLDTLTIGVEQKESYEHDLLPSEYFNPNVYTQDMVAESASQLAVDIEMYIEQKYGNKRYAKEVHAVVAFIHNVVENGMFHEDGMALNENFSLLSIKQKDPRAWQALQTLIHEAGGQEILRMILGKPTVWEDTSGVIKKTGKETNEEREKEMFLRLGNPLHVALARSVENLSEGENTAFKSAQREALQELYGTLPEELEFDLESHMLSLEVSLIMEKMNFESPEEAHAFEKLYRLFLDVGAWRWGKLKKIEECIQIDPEVWKSFLERLFPVFQDLSQVDKVDLYFSSQKIFRHFEKTISVLVKFLSKGVGFDAQKSLFESRETKWPLLKALLSGSGSPDARIMDIEKKVRDLQQKEEKCLSVTHTFVAGLNQFFGENKQEFLKQEISVEKNGDQLVGDYRELSEMVKSVNRKYLSHVCGLKEGLELREQYSSPGENSNIERLASSAPLCDFRGWHLREDVLTGLHLQDMDFRGANMYGAVFGGKQVQEIRNCNFSHANMAKVFLQRVNFETCDFIGTDFTHAQSQFEQGDKASLESAFLGCCFDQADLRYGKFCGLKIQKCHGKESDFGGAQFTKCVIERSKFERTNFHHTTFDQSQLLFSSFIDGDFNQSTFSRSAFEDSKFQGCAFKYQVDMENMRLKDCVFELDEFNVRVKGSFYWNRGRLDIQGACNIKHDDTNSFTMSEVFVRKTGNETEVWSFPVFSNFDNVSFVNVTLDDDGNSFFHEYGMLLFIELKQKKDSKFYFYKHSEKKCYFACKWKNCRYVLPNDKVYPFPENFTKDTSYGTLNQFFYDYTNNLRIK